MELSARSVSSAISSSTVCSRVARRAMRQRTSSPVFCSERVVHVIENAGEQLVVVAELEQLRVGVLEQLNRGFGAGVAVVEKCRVPADHGQVVLVIGNARLQHLSAFAGGEREPVAAHNLRDFKPVIAGQVGGSSRAACCFAHVKDEVVLAEPARVGLDHRAWPRAQPLAHDGLDARGKINIPHPAAGQMDQAFPVARRRRADRPR